MPETGGMGWGSAADVASYLRVSQTTLRNWRKQGRGPDFSERDGHVVYFWSAVAAFLDECATDEPEGHFGADLGWVYFVQCRTTGLIKIGTTKRDPEKRLATLQTGCPTELRLLGTLRGGEPRESRLHEDFSDYRVRGEWFRPGPRVVAYLRAHKIEVPLPDGEHPNPRPLTLP